MLAGLAAAGCSVIGADVDTAAPAAADRAVARTCELVRQGIDAFNAGDYTATVTAFNDALEPARRFAQASDDPIADELFEAVTYYAGLAPEGYREAFESSPTFRKYQSVTLGLCEQEPGTDGTPT